MKIWLREVFSENGRGSFSRVASGMHAVAGFAVLFYLVWHSRTWPSMSDWTGLSMFISTPYAANKISNAISSLGGSGSTDGKPSTP